MKKKAGTRLHAGNESGFFTLIVVTLALTALIGGATLLSMVTTRQPVSGAMDRLDRNQATPEDMNALQNAGTEMARTARIAAAGGSLIGGGGPVPNPASPGPLSPGDKAIAGIIPRVIGRLTNQASQPALTRDNPLPDTLRSGQNAGNGSGGYNPLHDPNIKNSGRGLQSPGEVDRLGQDFQNQLPGGSDTRQQPSGMDGTVIPQPGRGGTDPAASDNQGGDYYSPYYPGDGRRRRGPDWERWATDPRHRPSDGRGGHEKPAVRPGGGSSSGSQQGTSGACPPGCHVKRDGTGGCDCSGN
ncbi:MAG: hypothetical protein C0402_15320 [Thermodesulfovibrio sp.]|nr:hypothetical protein [Thermodesulfovibrio sp.]